MVYIQKIKVTIAEIVQLSEDQFYLSYITCTTNNEILLFFFSQITFSIGLFLGVDAFSPFSGLTAADTTEGLTSDTKR